MCIRQARDAEALARGRRQATARGAHRQGGPVRTSVTATERDGTTTRRGRISGTAQRTTANGQTDRISEARRYQVAERVLYGNHRLDREDRRRTRIGDSGGLSRECEWGCRAKRGNLERLAHCGIRRYCSTRRGRHGVRSGQGHLGDRIIEVTTRKLAVRDVKDAGGGRKPRAVRQDAAR